MLNLISIGIENKITSGASCFSLEVGRDLFGAWSIQTRRGQEFARGRTKRYIENQKEYAQARVRKILSRRLAGTQRLDSIFRYIDVADDENIFSWVPTDKCPLNAVRRTS